MTTTNKPESSDAHLWAGKIQMPKPQAERDAEQDARDMARILLGMVGGDYKRAARKAYLCAEAARDAAGGRTGYDARDLENLADTLKRAEAVLDAGGPALPRNQ